MMDVLALKEEISKNLELSVVAGRDASAGIPQENTRALTAAENNIMSAAEQKGWNYIKRILEHRKAADAAMADCRKIVGEVGKVIHKRQSVQPPDSSSFELAKRRMENAATSYARFKNQNDLTRDATGDDRLAQFLWALMIVALESVMNSFFFQQVATAGLIGGFFIAFIISIINIGFAFLGGVLGMRYAVNHCSANVKIAGLLCFAACFAVSMTVVAMSAWFRGNLDAVDFATVEDLPAVLQIAWTKSVDSFFAADFRSLFASLYSFSLALMGLLCAIGGVWKGYEFDDPYPGFGAMWRSMEEAREHLEEEQEKYTAIMDRWRDADSRPLAMAEDKIDKAAAVMKLELEGMRHACVDDVSESTARLAQALLSEYRDANAVGRKVPAYFQEYPKRDSFPALRDEYERLHQQADALQSEGTQLWGECRSLQDKINVVITER